ncbi:unnamed protein product, partial [Ectocarpus sp. 4 AP-2014]
MVVGCQPLAGESMRWLKHTVSGLANPHDAAAKNRLAKMEKYVQQGGDVNKPNKLGDTPLHEACAYIRDNGDSSKGKRRKGKGVGKDRRKVGKKLTRRQMGEGGPLEMLELLLRAGSNINAQNIVGDAPLHKAALNGRALSADYLIRAGANVNIRNEFAQTPLHAACVSGNIEVVQRLVQGGADTGAQDAAEDTPFHEACRHQYEGISIYLMGLVNNPETSQGLKLWEGLDPSWEKMLRSRSQAHVEDGTEEDVSRPRDMSTAAAASGLSSVRLGVTTPSTTHNSLMSSESAAMGLGVSNRTPARRDVFSTSGNRDRGGGGGDTVAPTRERKMMMPPRGEAASTKGSTKERKMMSAQSAAQVQPGVHHQRTTTRNRGSDSAAPAAGAGMSSSDGARVDGTRSGSRPSSATRRRRRSREGDAPPGETSPRVFSNGAADVLAWQATKVQSAKQGRLIERAREALRETEHEAEMARSRSMTSLGDDEGSIDTCNTADSPTTVGSRSNRPGERRQRRAISPAAKPAETLEVSDLDADGNPQLRRANVNANAAADLSDAESQPSRGSRRVKPVATNGTGCASATAAAAAAEAAADDARGRAVSPVMPTPSRAEGRDDVGGHAPRRESGRRQSARLAKGQVVSVRSPVARVSRRPSGFSKADDVGGSSRRSSRRGSSSRSAATSSAAVGSGEGGGDAGGSRRSSGGSRSSRGPSDHGQSHNKHGVGESRSAMAAAAEPAAAAPPRRSKEEGVRAENGEGRGGRSPSARRERHRKRGGGESSSRKSVGGGSGSSSSRRRDTKVTSSSSSRRSQREGSDGHATTAVPTTQAPAPASSSPAHSRATTAAVAATSVPKVSHESRSHSGAREGRASSSRAKEGRGTSSRTKDGRERRTPAASSPGGRLYATAPRQRPSSPDLCPPTWASNVPSTLEDASHKRVVASDFPARRVVSPYNSRKWEPPAGGRRTRSSASPKRSSSPERRSALPPPASRPVEKEIDPEGEDAEREAAVNDSSHASSFPTETVGDSASLPEAATAAAEAKPVATLYSAVPEAASARKTWEAKPTAAANGVATAAAVEDGVVQESPARSPAASAESEGPPLIDALLMEKKAATDGDSTAARADKEEGLRQEREDRASCTASTKSNPTRSFTAIETSKSIVFSDSDSEVDNGGSTTGSNDSAKETPTSGGDVQPMAALSAVSTVFARQRSGDKKGETAVLGNKQADSSSSSSSSSVSGAVSAEVLDSDRKADGPAASVSRLEEAGSGDGGGTATTASKEDRQGLPSYQDALAAGAASAAAAAAVPRPVRPDVGPEAVDDGAAAPAEGEGRGTVEPSSAPQNCLRPFSSSTIPSTMAVLAGGGGGGRPRSAALGRPGMPSAKVTMPIAGGRAAWNKFLATTAQGGPEESAAAADGDGEREKKEGGEALSAEGEAGVGASGSMAGNAVAAGSGNHAATLAAKGPRGFTNPAQSQEGPNKGPAGAFSGNSMWRLAGGTAAGAGRARSGVAANGHGGYSNPLAAMRAGGSGGGAETSSGGGGGGGVVNPLSGLRGAASMGGAGVSNPLARGRGPIAGGRRVGGMANPMLRGGGGDVGGLARGTGGGVPPFSSSGGTTGRTAPPPPPPRDNEGSLSPGPATMPPLSSSPTEMGGAPAIPAAMSWGPSPSSADTTTAAAGNDGHATEAAASTGGGEGNAAMRRGGGSERPPTEFRAISSNGSWPTDGALVPPRRRAAAREAQPHSVTERGPGQEKVGGLV